MSIYQLRVINLLFLSFALFSPEEEGKAGQATLSMHKYVKEEESTLTIIGEDGFECMCIEPSRSDGEKNVKNARNINF